jgi:hypothetical protein
MAGRQAGRFAAWLKQQPPKPTPAQAHLDIGDGWQPPAPTAAPRRYCKCCMPRWDIGPDAGRCTGCGADVRDWDVRRWHAIACEERRRIAAKGWLGLPSDR